MVQPVRATEFKEKQEIVVQLRKMFLSRNLRVQTVFSPNFSSF